MIRNKNKSSLIIFNLQSGHVDPVQTLETRTIPTDLDHIDVKIDDFNQKLYTNRIQTLHSLLPDLIAKLFF